VFIQPLQELAADRVETHVLSFEIAMRQQKAMLAIRCIQNCKRLATMDKYDVEKSAAPQLEAKLQHHLLLTRFGHLSRSIMISMHSPEPNRMIAKNVTLKIPDELEVMYKQALDELQDSFTSKDLLHNNDQFTSYWSSQQDQMPLDTFNTGLRELAMINVILAGEDGKENALKVIAQCQVRSTGLYRREALKVGYHQALVAYVLISPRSMNPSDKQSRHGTVTLERIKRNVVRYIPTRMPLHDTKVIK